MTDRPHKDGPTCAGPCACVPAPAGAAVSFSVADLVRRGPTDLPSELVSSKHLIYSSPAALAFNSPGAEGFGVKRAGLSIPDSVMLIVSPGCCGRNTSLVSRLPGYRDRFFYLTMDQTDVVTSRHLKLIPEAVREVCEGLAQQPSMVMICITCVDALLGTDMERVCTQASKAAGVPVRPCYMYALTREGRRPPMVYVREELYSLLERRPRRSRVANVMGFFSPLRDGCELYGLLGQVGIRTVNELARCSTYDEYLSMSEANFNLVLDPEARVAAADLERRLGMPSVELRRLYQVERIASQYEALGKVLGCDLDDSRPHAEAIAALASFSERHAGARVAIGECANADPFELALALAHAGLRVTELYATVTDESFAYLRHLAEVSPETRVYSNLEPTMLDYDASFLPADVTIGHDAAYYQPDAPNVAWNDEVQPFGYEGLVELLRRLDEVMA